VFRSWKKKGMTWKTKRGTWEVYLVINWAVDWFTILKHEHKYNWVLNDDGSLMTEWK
jgi:hypothetical protein